MKTARESMVDRAVALSVVSILLSGIVGASAVVVAITTGSLSLLGFGVDAAIDSVASVALIGRFLIERRQPHRAARVETVAEGVVGVALLLLAAYLVIGALRSLASQGHPESSAGALILLLVSLVALPPIARAKYRVAVRLSSGALRADSVLTGVAAMLAALSLLSFGLDQIFGLWWADAAAALVVAAVVVREGQSSIVAARHPVVD